MNKPPAPQKPEPRPVQLEHAPSALQVVVCDPDGSVVFSEYARLRNYRTGSWGYRTAGKTNMPRVPEQRLQINIGLTVIGSKDWNGQGE